MARSQPTPEIRDSYNLISQICAFVKDLEDGDYHSCLDSNWLNDQKIQKLESFKKRLSGFSCKQLTSAIHTKLRKRYSNTEEIDIFKCNIDIHHTNNGEFEVISKLGCWLKRNGEDIPANDNLLVVIQSKDNILFKWQE